MSHGASRVPDLTWIAAIKLNQKLSLLPPCRALLSAGNRAAAGIAYAATSQKEACQCVPAESDALPKGGGRIETPCSQFRA